MELDLACSLACQRWKQGVDGMEHLLENYGEISDEEVEPSAAVEVPEHQQPSAGASSNELLQQLPPDVLTMFNDSGKFAVEGSYFNILHAVCEFEVRYILQ